MNTPARTFHILMIDDHAILRDGLRMLLEARLAGVAVGSASSLSEAMQSNFSPDAILLDIKLPGINGVEGLPPIKQKWPQAHVVMLSSQDDMETRRQTLERGAVAFISKAEASERIVDVMLALQQGQFPQPALQATPDNSQPSMTPRQCEVLNLLSLGMSNKMIAKKLCLSENTIRRHIQDIFFFLQVASRTEAVFKARSLGLIS